MYVFVACMFLFLIDAYISGEAISEYKTDFTTWMLILINWLYLVLHLSLKLKAYISQYNMTMNICYCVYMSFV